MKTLKEYMGLKCKNGYLKNGDEIDVGLAMQITDGTIGDEELYAEWDSGAIQGKHPTDVLSCKGLFYTIYRRSKYNPFVFKGECFQDSIRNVNPEFSKKIYVCSRYRAESQDEIDQNINDVKKECRRIVYCGDIPIAPHLYFTQFLNDKDEEKREFGIMAGMQAMKECDSMVVIIRDEKISDRMHREMSYVVNVLGIPITMNNITTEKR